MLIVRKIAAGQYPVILNFKVNFLLSLVPDSCLPEKRKDLLAKLTDDDLGHPFISIFKNSKLAYYEVINQYLIQHRGVLEAAASYPGFVSQE